MKIYDLSIGRGEGLGVSTGFVGIMRQSGALATERAMIQFEQEQIRKARIAKEIADRKIMEALLEQPMPDDASQLHKDEGDASIGDGRMIDPSDGPQDGFDRSSELVGAAA